MVSFAQFVTAVVGITITGASAFTRPCRYPYDNCGWVLANGFYGTIIPPHLFFLVSFSSKTDIKLTLGTHQTGYTYSELQAAANTTDGSKIYDALYSCDTETGEISYLNWCGGPAKCETGIVPNDNCRS